MTMIQKWKRGFAATALAGIAIAGNGLSASAQTFKAIDLGMLNDAAYSRATGINNYGVVVGVSGKTDAAGNDVQRATVWAGKTPVDLNAILKSDRSIALGVSDYGDVAGGAMIKGVYRPFIWPVGEKDAMFIGGPDGLDTFAVISGEASAVGYYRLKDGTMRPLMWKKGATDDSILRAELPLPKGATSGAANAMNKSGAVAGFADSGAIRHAMVWTAASGAVDLGVLPGGQNSFASSISEAGMVVGVADDKTGIPHAFAWDSKNGMKDLGTFAKGAKDLAMSTTGSSGRITGLLGATAFGAKDGKLIDFSTMMPGAAPLWKWVGGSNAFGYVPATALTANGVPHAFLVAPKIKLKSFLFDKTTVNQNSTIAGNLMFDTPTPVSGVMIRLLSDNPAIKVPDVFMPDRPDIGFQIPFACGGVTKETKVTLSVTFEDQTLSASVTVLTVNAATILKELSLASPTVPGGLGSQGKIVLNDAAPATGIQVALNSDNPTVMVPQFVTVPGGKKEATFDISTKLVDKEVVVGISAAFKNERKTASLKLTVFQNVLKDMQLGGDSVLGGTKGQGRVLLAGPASKTDATVVLKSDNAALIVPASVVVKVDKTDAMFDFSSQVVTKDTQVNVTATWNGVTIKRTIVVKAAQKAGLKDFTIKDASIEGGKPTQGHIVLTAPAPAGGISLAFGSDGPAAKPAATVVVPAGKIEADFDIPTSVMTAETTVAISGSLDGVIIKRKLIVTPVTKAVVIAEFTLAKTQLIGGEATQGRIVLSDVAPATGLVVKLTSDGTTATFAASITIPGGKKDATFDIKTLVVTKETTVTITAALGTSNKAVKLVVSPKK